MTIKNEITEKEKKHYLKCMGKIPKKEMLRRMKRRLTEEQNKLLNKHFSTEEVRDLFLVMEIAEIKAIMKCLMNRNKEVQK